VHKKADAVIRIGLRLFRDPNGTNRIRRQRRLNHRTGNPQKNASSDGSRIQQDDDDCAVRVSKRRRIHLAAKACGADLPRPGFDKVAEVPDIIVGKPLFKRTCARIAEDWRIAVILRMVRPA
jgi:hypothetical protein